MIYNNGKGDKRITYQKVRTIMETLTREQRIAMKNESDRQRRLAYQKKYRDANKEKEAARKHDWYEKNKGAVASKHAEYYRNNIDKISEYHKQKYANRD